MNSKPKKEWKLLGPDVPPSDSIIFIRGLLDDEGQMMKVEKCEFARAVSVVDLDGWNVIYRPINIHYTIRKLTWTADGKTVSSTLHSDMFHMGELTEGWFELRGNAWRYATEEEQKI